MQTDTEALIFMELDPGAGEIPYELLLLADPSIEMIEECLHRSIVFIVKRIEEVVGVVVLTPLAEELAEIKNIAVKPECQGKGIGSWLIARVIGAARDRNYKQVCIGTANSSIAQLYLYQKLGFELTEIKKNFFMENYPEPVYENSIRAKHMLVLTREL